MARGAIGFQELPSLGKVEMGSRRLGGGGRREKYQSGLKLGESHELVKVDRATPYTLTPSAVV